MLSMCCASSSAAQSTDAASESQPALPSVASLVLDLGRDIRRLPSLESAAIIGGAAGASLMLWGEDPELTRRAFDRWGQSGVFVFGDVAGDLPVQAAAALSVFFVGRLADSPRVATVGADLVRAQILNTAATHLTKVVVRRHRPDGASFSFPSGHTSSTFATAAVLQRHFGWRAGVPAYALAAYTGVSRIARNSHFPSDVVFGAAIGVVMGRTVTVGRKGDVLVSPVLSPGVVGVTVEGWP